MLSFLKNEQLILEHIDLGRYQYLCDNVIMFDNIKPLIDRDFVIFDHYQGRIINISDDKDSATFQSCDVILKIIQSFTESGLKDLIESKYHDFIHQGERKIFFFAIKEILFHEEKRQYSFVSYPLLYSEEGSSVLSVVSTRRLYTHIPEHFIWFNGNDETMYHLYSNRIWKPLAKRNLNVEEFTILQFLCMGYTKAQISKQMNISVGKLNFIIEKFRKDFDAQNVTELLLKMSYWRFFPLSMGEIPLFYL